VADSNHASAVSGQAVSSEWADTLEYINDSAKAMADKMIAIGVPVPSSVGFELEDNMGAVIAEAEMAWEERKIAYLLPEQEEYRTVFENQGWAVITDCTELAITIFEGRNS
jgi:DEAD/DEAH box helicase domain-containing protein